jgi:hypothetical protein
METTSTEIGRTFDERIQHLSSLEDMKLLIDGDLVEVGIELEGNDGYSGLVYVLSGEEELVAISPPEGDTICEYFIRKNQVEIGWLENIMTKDGQKVRVHYINENEEPTKFTNYNKKMETAGLGTNWLI